MPKHWRIYPHDSERVAVLARSAGVSPVVAQVLLARGLDDAERVRDFLDCKFSRLRNPFELPGMTAADYVHDVPRLLRDVY